MVPARVETTMFTESNTEGFTPRQIETLNAAFAIVADEFPDARDYSLFDAINNEWTDGVNAQTLAERAIRSLSAPAA